MVFSLDGDTFWSLTPDYLTELPFVRTWGSSVWSKLKSHIFLPFFEECSVLLFLTDFRHINPDL